MRQTAVAIAFFAALAWFSGAMSVPAHALSYSSVEFDDGKCKPNCASVIVASGSIAASEVEDLQWFITQSGKQKRFAKVMLIHSPGGNAYGGLTLGSYLRQNGITVVVARSDGADLTKKSGMTNGLCGSACVFVLAGGSKRIVPPGSKVAVHGSRAVQDEVHDRIAGTVQAFKVDKAGIVGAFASYYKIMGVNPELAKFSEKIPHSEFKVLTPGELSKFRLAQSKF